MFNFKFFSKFFPFRYFPLLFSKIKKYTLPLLQLFIFPSEIVINKQKQLFLINIYGGTTKSKQNIISIKIDFFYLSCTISPYFITILPTIDILLDDEEFLFCLLCLLFPESQFEYSLQNISIDKQKNSNLLTTDDEETEIILNLLLSHLY